MQVAPRTYRSWRTNPPAARVVTDARVVDKLRSLRTGGLTGGPLPEVLYGRRKMTAWLQRTGHPGVSKHTVDRLMRVEGMRGLIRGRKVRTTIAAKDGVRAGDLLNRDFRTTAPNRAWVTDFTYVPIWSGFTYVAFVIDLYSRAIVGWSAAATKDVAFVESCLSMALWRRDHTGRPVGAGMIHHSDAGSQGGFNWPSQHLDREVERWVLVRSKRGLALIADRFPRPAVRPLRGARTVSGSGSRSLAAPGQRMRAAKRACRARSGSDGFATLAA